MYQKSELQEQDVSVLLTFNPFDFPGYVGVRQSSARETDRAKPQMVPTMMTLIYTPMSQSRWP